MAEERDRRVDRFTYVRGGDAHPRRGRASSSARRSATWASRASPTTRRRADSSRVKESEPQGIFQTGVDFAAGTATNGSPTTENSINLFDPALAGLPDFADVFALSNLPPTGRLGHLLVLSQESGRIVNIDRARALSRAR